LNKTLKKDILAIINEATETVTESPEFDVLQTKAVDKPTDGPTDYAKGVKKAPKRRADKDTGPDSDGAKDTKDRVTFADVTEKGGGPSIREEKDEDEDEDEDEDKDSTEDKKDDAKKKDGKKENPFDKFKKKKKTVKEEKDEEDEGDEEDMAEDVSALFAGETLTETFKKKAVVIFETAVRLRVDQKVVELEEAFEVRLLAETQEIEEALETKVDGFLSYVTEQWVTEHNLELENGIRTEVAESFIAGLKSLFEQHSIDIPDTKVDIVEKLSEDLARVTQVLNAQLKVNATLQESLNLEKRKSVLQESLKDLPASQADKIRTLSESLSFKNATSFEDSITVLKETYAGTGKKPVSVDLLTEELSNTNVETPETNSLMDRYNKTISRHGQK
jgi:hypothetical protein